MPPKFRNGQSTVGGPKWTKIGQNGPFWSILVHFGLANTKIQFGIRPFRPKWSKRPFWTISVQYTFRQYCGHSLQIQVSFNIGEEKKKPVLKRRAHASKGSQTAGGPHPQRAPGLKKFNLERQHWKNQAFNTSERCLKNGSSKSLVLKSFSGEGRLWDSSLLVALTLWDMPVLCTPHFPSPDFSLGAGIFSEQFHSEEVHPKP